MWVDIPTVIVCTFNLMWSFHFLIHRWTPKVAAGIKGHVAVIKLFLQRERDVHSYLSTKYEGKTFLDLAHANNNNELVKLLEEWTPFFTACCSGYLPVVERLLSDEDVNKMYDDGYVIHK